MRTVKASCLKPNERGGGFAPLAAAPISIGDRYAFAGFVRADPMTPEDRPNRAHGLALLLFCAGCLALAAWMESTTPGKREIYAPVSATLLAADGYPIAIGPTQGSPSVVPASKGR